ncbi:MAG TPA: hypothetical protein VGQ55_14025 [Pyrinomonadaceae bacterium]|nr:hypothetical protein [Pyrinomonadaceae bacterium]
MKTNSQPEIVIEFDERIAIDRAEHQFEAYCADCKQMAEMATPKMAGILTNVTERGIFRLIEAKSVHFVEGNRIFVCIASIKKLTANSNTAAADIRVSADEA